MKIHPFHLPCMNRFQDWQPKIPWASRFLLATISCSFETRACFSFTVFFELSKAFPLFGNLHKKRTWRYTQSATDQWSSRSWEEDKQPDSQNSWKLSLTFWKCVMKQPNLFGTLYDKIRDYIRNTVAKKQTMFFQAVHQRKLSDSTPSSSSLIN